MSAHGDIPAMNVLLVEDNTIDARLIREALDGTQLPYRLDVAADPEQALRLMRRSEPPRPRADLVLLDFDIPRKGARELLIELKTDPLLRRIPVIVLASGKLDADFLASYEEYTHCFMPKPVNLDKFVALVQALRDFWLRQAILPAPATAAS
jgi:CheY-like chemotaxis protein